MKKGVLLFLILIGDSAAYAVENPVCFINAIDVAGSSNGQIRFQVRDANNSSQQYTGNVYLDDPTHSSVTDVVSTTSIGGTIVLNITTNTWGTGTINPLDGNQHHFYFSMVTLTTGTITNCTGDGWPFKYNIAASTYDYTYPIPTTVVRATTPNNLALIGNSSDTYSTGDSGGTKICLIAGTTFYDNGVVGYYANKYGVPCNHVHLVSGTTDQAYTQTQGVALYASITPALGSDEQAIALGWLTPQFINLNTSQGASGGLHMSMPGLFANGGTVLSANLIVSAGFLFGGDPPNGAFNPMFNTATATPFTTYGVRPTVMLGAAVCDSSCASLQNWAGNSTLSTYTANFPAMKGIIDAAFAARDSNPTGRIARIDNTPNSATPSAGFRQLSSLGYGNALSPKVYVTTQTTTSSVLNISTNVVYYDQAASQPTYTSTVTVSPGIAYMSAHTSFNGLLGNNSSEMPIQAWLNFGAVGSCGTMQEPPGQSLQKILRTG